ncbi:MAG: MBL fold metallo-hydrolase [Pseudomonadota bacterium]
MIERTIGKWTLRGRSVGGFGTSLHIKELGVALDMGFFFPETLRGDHLFLSHGHPDHVGALVSWLGARRLLGMNTANLFAPVGLAEGLVDVLSRWQEISGVEFDYRIFGAAPGAELALRGDIRVRAFSTFHRLETLGYLFERETRRLRSDLRGLPGEEIRELRAAGNDDDLFEVVRTPLVAYVPDTLPEALDAMPAACWRAQLLIVEATFLDDRKPMEKIREGGHVHLDDILARLEQFTGDHVALFHFSRSYSPDEVQEILASKVPAAWRERVHAFV